MGGSWREEAGGGDGVVEAGGGDGVVEAGGGDGVVEGGGDVLPEEAIFRRICDQWRVVCQKGVSQ